jgi:hypothetical protein
VDKCFDPNIRLDQNDETIDEEGLKRLIYEEIVQPLEDELDQGFSNTVSADNLNEVVQSLNLIRNLVLSPHHTRMDGDSGSSRVSSRELARIKKIR